MPGDFLGLYEANSLLILVKFIYSKKVCNFSFLTGFSPAFTFSTFSASTHYKKQKERLRKKAEEIVRSKLVDRTKKPKSIQKV